MHVHCNLTCIVPPPIHTLSLEGLRRRKIKGGKVVLGKRKHLFPPLEDDSGQEDAHLQLPEPEPDSDGSSSENIPMSPPDNTLADKHERRTKAPKMCDVIPGTDEPQRTESSKKSAGKKRYILFVGNLPYTASSEDVVGHFEGKGVPVKEVRMATVKETGKSRGFSFVEFKSPKDLQVSKLAW